MKRHHEKSGALFFDLSWIATLYVTSLSIFNLSPFPSLIFGAFFLFTVIFLLILQIHLSKKTLGQWLWDKSLWGGLKVSLTITALLFLLNGVFFTQRVLLHPYTQKTTEWLLPSFLPDAEDFKEKRWSNFPLYFTLGPWPTEFHEQAIYYQLPYQKGPPRQFPGSVFLRLEPFGASIEIEGPKTPEQTFSSTVLRECLLHPKMQEEKSWMQCQRMKEQTLKRHLTEMKTAFGNAWTLRWFEIDNPVLAVDERPQGVYLKKETPTGVEERFILINETGRHQALILRRKQDELSETASLLFLRTVQGLRTFNQLQPGRAWINQNLSQVQMQARLQNQQKDDQSSFQKMHQLIETQRLLISKISVEPSDKDAYFHLGGMAHLILKEAKKIRESETQALSENDTVLVQQWAQAARQTLDAAYRYLQDVTQAQDPSLQQLQMLWIEARAL
jgi:hypothetical protein